LEHVHICNTVVLECLLEPETHVSVTIMHPDSFI
jgi:hypothetical protein